ncbi:hypothetical protein [Streptomyces griseomycini]|uniref:Uncharacterized protein n=1 Tax=Streptomyces griseomycini TaxID=66895 RepID=A0A7W7VA52_9ACTN|nr:hypothetical protein [Streptomyces griseomycini]MBB4902595.1 hypothetical protein [Streptomyces griseomycini]GGR54363.1 hypothetical protein GCM10015536_69660 [Streptomyces griseomycini]
MPSFDTLAHANGLREALDQLDVWLARERETALDATLPVEERVSAGVAYSELVHTLRVHLGAARDALPVLETRQAYSPVAATGPERSPEAARLWAAAAAAESAAAVLSAVLQMLPLDGGRVRDRAALEDPHMDLGD